MPNSTASKSTLTSRPDALRLLVVSRESAVLHPLWSAAEANSWQVETAVNGWDAMERVQSDDAPHVLMLDVPRDDMDSLRLLPWLRRLRPELPVFVLCHPEDAAKQKEAIKLGARDVLIRPLRGEQLEAVIHHHAGAANDDGEVEMTSEDIEQLGEDEFFLSVSPVMQKLRAQAGLLAQVDVPVLIVGEPGSGKGTVARLIHKLSVYSGFKFLRVNCADMPGDLLEIELFGRENGSSQKTCSSGNSRSPHGKLEIGEKGTLLLDEITEMPLALQARLLQVLQDKRFARSSDAKPASVNRRILAASSDDLERALAEKRLRSDLYYRLSAFTIQVPPLRQRKEELKVLLRYSMHKLARYYGLPAREFTPAALAACLNHSWPGNLTELEAFVKRYLVTGEREMDIERPSRFRHHPPGWSNPGLQISVPEDEQIAAASPQSLKALIQSVKGEAEKNAIAAALQKTGWNRKAAARLLGVSYRTMLYKIEQYQMNATLSEAYLSPVAESRLNASIPISQASEKGNGKAS